MARECSPDSSTSERLADVRSAERCLTPSWPLRQAALWTVKNAVFGWSRTAGLWAPPTKDVTLAGLPVQLRQELLDAMLKLKPDGREVMRAVKLLVKGGILSFDMQCLNECHHHDVRQVIKLLTDSGHLIRHIAITGQWFFDYDKQELLAGLLTSLSNVQHLCLQETSTGAPELSLILDHCPKVRNLEISHYSLSDSDVTSVAGYSYTEMRVLKVPSSVKGQGLLTLLRVFPNLQHLECAHLDELLDCLDKSDSVWWKERMAGLLGIKTTYPIGHDTLNRIVQWCPNLTLVSIEIQEHVALNPLSALHNLTSLELKNSAILPVNYQNQVVCLLSSVGPRLEHLCLEHFDVVDLSRASELCPNLQSLELRWFTNLSVSRVPKGLKPFCKLRSLCIRPRTNQNVKRDVCQVLLSNCIQLERLEMYCCYGLDDALLSHVLKSNPLDQLSVLLLRHGHGVTGTGLRKLVGMSSKMKLWDFGAVSQEK